MIWYVALDENTKGFIVPTNSATKLTGIKGETTNLDKFTIKLSNYSGIIEHESYLSTNVPGLQLLTETVISSLRLKQSKHIVLAGDLLNSNKVMQNITICLQFLHLIIILGIKFYCNTNNS